MGVGLLVGSGSLKKIFVTVSVGSVPAFEITIVYRSVSPACTTFGSPVRSVTVFTTLRLGAKSTVSVSVDVLLAGFGSVVPTGAATVAVFTSDAVAVALVWATTVYVAVPPTARSINSFRLPVPAVAPVELVPVKTAVQLAAVTTDANVSATVAPRTKLGPALARVIV